MTKRPHKHTDDPTIIDPAIEPVDVPTADGDVLDKVTLLLVSGMTTDAIAAACRDKLGVAPDRIPATISAARVRITVAADYNREEQIGRAVTRLNDLYARSIRVQDVKTALAAQRDLTRLLGLNTPKPSAPPMDHSGPTEDPQIRAHLEGLGLGRPGDPTAELCRLAASEIIRTRTTAGRAG